MPYMGRGQMYDAVIHNRTKKALEEKEAEFEEKHEQTSDAELLEYVKACAEKLKHTPWPGEITGGHYIKKRFGTWWNVIKKANLPEAKTPNVLENFKIYLEELENQKILYHKKKAEKKERAREREAKRSAKGKERRNSTSAV